MSSPGKSPFFALHEVAFGENTEGGILIVKKKKKKGLNKITLLE